MRLLPLLVLLLACKGAQDDDPYRPPSIQTADLESGITGESYAQWLEVQGGQAPLRWELTGDLPAGLVFNPAGAISGVPSQPDQVSVTVKVIDDRGESDTAEVSLAVALALDALPCGVTLGGEFGATAAVDEWNMIDWNEDQGYTWLQIPLPTDDTTRIELQLEAFGNYFEVYLAAPGTELGDQDLGANYRLYYAGFGDSVVVDLGTSYDLPTYQSFGDAINVLVVATTPGMWEASSVCSDGPIFSDLVFYPTLVGDDFFVNFNIIGDNEGVRIWTDDTLPAWISWDETTGRLTGIADDVGGYEFDVNVEDANGKTRTERAGFGIFDIQALACDESVSWTPDVGYYETLGLFSNYYNVSAYRVFETLADPRYSQITAHLDGFSGGEVGFASPGAPAYRASGPSDSDWTNADFAASISPQSRPPLSAYQAAANEVRALGYSYFSTSSEATFWFECDPAPRPDIQAFPVLDPLATEAWDFDVAGGVPPFMWQTLGLPAGVTIDASGRLESDQPAEGEYAITVRVTDDVGLATAIDFSLFVGDDAACLGYPRLACGDSQSGTFTDAFWSNLNDGSAIYCMDSSTWENDSLQVTLTTGVDTTAMIALSSAGADPLTELAEYNYISLAYAGPEDIDVGVYDHSLGLSDYEDQVVFLSAIGWSPGDWSFDMDCNP